MDVISQAAPEGIYLVNGSYQSESYNRAIIETIDQPESRKGKDKVNVDFQDLYKSLTVAAQEVIDKLNELLKDSLPNGIQSLRPEEVTPEATADRIVQGATAFFSTYARQNPTLEGEELLQGFMKTIRSGIQSGYDQASATLEEIGAFEFEGVKDGIEETKSLIEQKLAAYEEHMRKQLGIDSVKENVATQTKQDLLSVSKTLLTTVSAEPSEAVLQ